MAFDRNDFDPNGSGSKGAQKIATYQTDDDISTVESAGYFDAVSSEMRTGDGLWVDANQSGTSVRTTKLYRVSVSGGSVTLDGSVTIFS